MMILKTGKKKYHKNRQLIVQTLGKMSKEQKAGVLAVKKLFYMVKKI